MFSFTTTHLRFICEATTPLRLEVENFRAGSNLRGALGQVMTRTYCAEPHPFAPLLRGEGNGERSHATTCPVHWLLAANEKPGQERRGYTLVPPANNGTHDTVKPNVRFEFGLTLFGNALQFLPYFVLAVPEMGRLGVGAGRGKFTLKSVWAENPFTRERECLLAEGDNLVHTPTLTITHSHVLNEAERLGQSLAERDGRLTIQFVTPTRLIEDGKLVQAPAFEVLFARLLKRLDELAEQFGSFDRSSLRQAQGKLFDSRSGGSGQASAQDKHCEPRGMDAAQALERIAARVRLVEQETRWVEVFSGSSRRGTASPLSGIVGRAVYAATPEVWSPLLPWLLWGQLAQVGKSAVKGNGVISVQ